jgi:rubrerythrin
MRLARHGVNSERRKAMEEFADVNPMFDLMRTREEISPIERLLNEFESHEAKEEISLEYYRKTLGSMPNPMTRFLMQLIVSDEEKHRAVLHAMVATLKGSLTWTKPAGSLEGAGDLAEMKGKLREVTDEFIRLEKDGIREYKILSKESSEYYRGLFKILLDSMIRDSEKHVELLEFLKGSLKDR